MGIFYSGAPRRFTRYLCVRTNICVAFVTARLRLSLGLPTHCQTLWSGSNPWAYNNLMKNTAQGGVLHQTGAPRRIRTLNLLIRSQMLYPIEPWAQRSYILYIFITIARKNNYFLSAAATVPIRPMIHHIKVLATNRFIITVAHRDLRAGTHDIAIRIKT